jgi:uncharacterized protein YggT (Ycf19 family)
VTTVVAVIAVIAVAAVVAVVVFVFGVAVMWKSTSKKTKIIHRLVMLKRFVLKCVRRNVIQHPGGDDGDGDEGDGGGGDDCGYDCGYDDGAV